MAYGITITVADEELVATSDDVLRLEIPAPEGAQQITNRSGSDATPFLADRANVLVTVQAVVLRTHASIGAAAVYLLGLIEATPRAGAVVIEVNDGTNGSTFTMATALIRVAPGALEGCSTVSTFTFTGSIPIQEP